jgi:hypothetical protein
MTAAERSEVPRESDHVKEHQGHSGGDVARQEFRHDERTSPRNPEGMHVPDEGAFETFIDGSGF